MKHSFNQAQTSGKESSGSITPPVGAGGLLLPLKNIFLTAGLVLASALGLLAQDCATGYCPASLTAHHKAGTVAPETVDITYGVTPLSGGCWITRNLGATIQPAAYANYDIASSGWYWQFNRKQGYRQQSTVTALVTNANWQTAISESSNWVIANDPCRLLLGGTWRIPTEAQWISAAALIGEGTGGAAYNHAMRIGLCGYYNVTKFSNGIEVYYWTSNQTNASNGTFRYFNASSGTITNIAKTSATVLRCMRDL